MLLHGSVFLRTRFDYAPLKPGKLVKPLQRWIKLRQDIIKMSIFFIFFFLLLNISQCLNILKKKSNCCLQNMEVKRFDYTFTLLTGSSNYIPFGNSHDCNGEHFKNPCPHFGTATIDTRGTGLIVDPSVWSNFEYFLCLSYINVLLLMYIQQW